MFVRQEHLVKSTEDGHHQERFSRWSWRTAWSLGPASTAAADSTGRRTSRSLWPQCLDAPEKCKEIEVEVKLLAQWGETSARCSNAELLSQNWSWGNERHRGTEIANLKPFADFHFTVFFKWYVIKSNIILSILFLLEIQNPALNLQ